MHQTKERPFVAGYRRVLDGGNGPLRTVEDGVSPAVPVPLGPGGPAGRRAGRRAGLGLRTNGVVVARRLVPADGRAVGDWADAFDVAGGRVGITVGDVCGHGAAVAEHAWWLERLLRAGLVNVWAPGAVARYAVEQLGDTGERFATAFIAVFDPATGLLRYANAGHPEPVHVLRTRPGAPADQDAAALVAPTGPMLADLFAGEDAWATATIRLGIDDMILVYTDGLVESRDRTGEPFGAQRLAAAVCRSPNRADPRHLLDDVFTAVDAHTAADPRDDRTAIALVRTAPEG